MNTLKKTWIIGLVGVFKIKEKKVYWLFLDWAKMN
jgi:hypothetical protein